MLAKVVELTLGKQAAQLLDDIKRAQALFKEVEVFYKRVLEQTPGAIPGWALEPGDVRRSISDATAAQQKVKDLVPLEHSSPPALCRCRSSKRHGRKRAAASRSAKHANHSRNSWAHF